MRGDQSRGALRYHLLQTGVQRPKPRLAFLEFGFGLLAFGDVQDTAQQQWLIPQVKGSGRKEAGEQGVIPLAKLLLQLIDPAVFA